MKCAVKKCERRAFVMYGSSWICGDCLVKILTKESERKAKLVEELEI